MNQVSMRIRELEASLDAHRLLLATISRRAEEAHAQLVRIAHELGGVEVTGLPASPGDPEELSAEKIASRIMTLIRARLPFHASNTLEEQVSESRKQGDGLRQQLDVQTRRASTAETALSDLKRQVEILDNNLAAERKKNRELALQRSVSEAPVPVSDHSAWFTEWSRSRGYERDRKLIVLMGESGIARGMEIEQKLVQEAILKRGAVYNAINACVIAGLVEREGGASALGHPSDILQLTGKGQWAYTRLTGHRPQPCEYPGLLKAHKSPRQTILVLSTADHFLRLGCAVERDPVTIQLPGGHISQPDLIVRKDGATFYLEVETGEKLDRPSLAQKWQNAMTIGGGQICIVVPRSGLMNTLQSHVLDWAAECGRTPQLYMTSLEYLRKCQPGESPWARIRNAKDAGGSPCDQ